MTEERVPINIPHSRAAEEGLLGALLIDPETLGRMALDPEDFYIERNRMIFQSMLDLDREGQSARLDERKQLDEVGGPARVMALVAGEVSSLNAEAYAAIIRERARRRRVIQTAQRLAQVGFDLDSDLSGGVSEAMDNLSRAVVSVKGAVHVAKFVSQIYDEVDRAVKNPTDVYGIPTGFLDWDRITYGLQKGEKVLLSGEPGVGKSVLAAQVLIHAARHGHPGVLYQLEMSGRQVVRRALAAWAKSDPKDSRSITTQKMRQGRLNDEEVIAFTRAVEEMSNLPVYISDASELTTVEMRADIARLKETHGIELVVIDYEGLLGDSPEQDDNARSKLVSKRTTAIAKDLDIAMISIGDMTKEGIKREVKGQGAVAGTARALHDAGQIVIMRKGENENTVRLTWEKMREGEGDRFADLVREPGFPMFRNAARY
jgi:replicative DNA helicase